MQDLKAYLNHSTVIDWHTVEVAQLAQQLAAVHSSKEGIAKACFEFVRDEIQHSWDYQSNPVTCSASDTLRHRTGFCYAKSHLLAALLRANNIPAGLCYQRLTIANDKPPFCLHGLNALYLEPYGWFRVDPRGNKPGVQAEFSPLNEQLAFTTQLPGETDLPEIWPEPLTMIINTLQRYTTYMEVAENLPDIKLAF